MGCPNAVTKRISLTCILFAFESTRSMSHSDELPIWQCRGADLHARAATTSPVIADDSKLTFWHPVSKYETDDNGGDVRTWLLVNTFIPLITLTDSFLSGTDSSWRTHFLSVE